MTKKFEYNYAYSYEMLENGNDIGFKEVHLIKYPNSHYEVALSELPNLAKWSDSLRTIADALFFRRLLPLAEHMETITTFDNVNEGLAYIRKYYPTKSYALLSELVKRYSKKHACTYVPFSLPTAISVGKAARRLGLTENEIREKCEKGELLALQNGEDWILDVLYLQPTEYLYEGNKTIVSKSRVQVHDGFVIRVLAQGGRLHEDEFVYYTEKEPTYPAYWGSLEGLQKYVANEFIDAILAL